MGGTIIGEHVVNLNSTNLDGDATFNELEGATIDTVTPDGSLDMTGANTGEDITIGDMEGTLTGEHLVNLTITNLGGDATINELDGANIDTVTPDGSLD